MEVTVVSIVVGALGTVTGRLLQELEDLEIKVQGDKWRPSKLLHCWDQPEP